MIGAKVEKPRSNRNASVLEGLVEDMPTEALQAVYDVAKEGVQNLLFKLVEELIVEIIQQGKIDSLSVRVLKLSPYLIGLCTQSHDECPDASR